MEDVVNKVGDSYVMQVHVNEKIRIISAVMPIKFVRNISHYGVK